MKSKSYDPIKYRIDSLKFANIKDKKILDIGTGKGYIAMIAAKKFNCDVTTIDISKEKIKIAKENAKKEKINNKIKFIEGNAKKMPFTNNSFYASISFNALHHSKFCFKNIIKEMFRVSKNKVVITEINKTGAEIFDKYVHPDENHKKMAISFNELNDSLKEHSTNIKVFKQKLMDTFVCEKLK
jgi:ubiquinone/menaquinone biosynthesis C-methylase UbiE